MRSLEWTDTSMVLLDLSRAFDAFEKKEHLVLLGMFLLF